MQRPHIIPSLSSQLGVDWGQVSRTITEAANVWNSYDQPRPSQPIPQTALGGTTATLVLVGGALILAYALISRRRG